MSVLAVLLVVVVLSTGLNLWHAYKSCKAGRNENRVAHSGTAPQYAPQCYYEVVPPHTVFVH